MIYSETQFSSQKMLYETLFLEHDTSTARLKE